MDYKEMREPYWRALREAVGAPVEEAMRELYELWDERMIDWFAGLYSREVGGYYYSQSARDNAPVYPDCESTPQALRFIGTSGMADHVGGDYGRAIPEQMRLDITKYVKGLQDKNGFFYNPQWSKEFTDSKLSRRARDLGWCTDMLGRFGEEPLYPTPIGKTVTAEERANMVVPENLKDKETFLAYLDGLDIPHRSYHAGNTLTSQMAQIIFRDKVLAEEGAGYSLVDTLIDYLNERQRPENGMWHEVTNYFAVNGLMKTSGVYGKAGVMMPHADVAVKCAIAAMTTDETPAAVTDIYNTWYAAARVLRHMNTLGGEETRLAGEKIRRDLIDYAPTALRATKEKLAVFKKEMCSFSYKPEFTIPRSQGCPVALPDTAEGDINATIICSSDILVYVYESLGISKLRVPIFGKAELDRYMKLIGYN